MGTSIEEQWAFLDGPDDEPAMPKLTPPAPKSMVFHIAADVDEPPKPPPSGMVFHIGEDEVEKPKPEAKPEERDSDGYRKMLIFDIETGPLDDSLLRKMLPPLVPPKHPGVFDPATVKLGGLKDPAKIQDKMEKARETHADLVARHVKAVEDASEALWATFKSRAALDATTGRIVAIGTRLSSDKTPLILSCDPNEESGLTEFWTMIQLCLQDRIPCVGFNIHGFDLPFLIRRSWILGIPIPLSVRIGRNWNPLFLDLMREWTFGAYQSFVSLNTLALTFGIPTKITEVDGVPVSGATFWQLWNSNQNRDAALKYLGRDLEIPLKLARLMGL